MRQEAVVYRQTEAQVSDGGGLFYRCTRAGRGPPARGMGKSSFFSSAMVNQPCVQKVGKQPPDEVLLFFFASADVNDCRFDLVSTKLCRKLLKVSNRCCRRVDPNPITCRNWYNKCRRKRWIPKHQSYDSLHIEVS